MNVSNKKKKRFKLTVCFGIMTGLPYLAAISSNVMPGLLQGLLALKRAAATPSFTEKWAGLDGVKGDGAEV